MTNQRDEFEQRNFDQVEEAKLALRDHQLRLNGMWLDTYEGCPHLINPMPIHDESIGKCEQTGQTCVYETGRGPCELFLQILEEWRKEGERDKTSVVS